MAVILNIILIHLTALDNIITYLNLTMSYLYRGQRADKKKTDTFSVYFKKLT